MASSVHTGHSYAPGRTRKVETHPFFLHIYINNTQRGWSSVIDPEIHILRNTYFPAKTKPFQFPLGRLLSRGMNTVMLDVYQDSETTIAELAGLLKAGKNIVIFPEGTRSNTGKLGRFSNTFAMLSKQLSIPVFPAAIKGAFQLLPGNRKFPGPGSVEVTVFPPIDPAEKDIEAISRTAFTQIKNSMEAE